MDHEPVVLGDNLVAFAASTPLLNLRILNDSKVIPASERLDPAGFIKEFTGRMTHVYTEDNEVDVFESEAELYVSVSLDLPSIHN